MSLRVKTKLCGQATIGNENSYMYHQVQKLFLKFSNRLQKYTKNLMFSTSHKKTTKSDFSMSQRLQAKFFARKEHSDVYDQSQNSL